MVSFCSNMEIEAEEELRKVLEDTAEQRNFADNTQEETPPAAAPPPVPPAPAQEEPPAAPAAEAHVRAAGDAAAVGRERHRPDVARVPAPRGQWPARQVGRFPKHEGAVQ